MSIELTNMSDKLNNKNVYTKTDIDNFRMMKNLDKYSFGSSYLISVDENGKFHKVSNETLKEKIWNAISEILYDSGFNFFGKIKTYNFHISEELSEMKSKMQKNPEKLKEVLGDDYKKATDTFYRIRKHFFAG